MKILTKGKYYGTRDAEVNINGIVLSEYQYHTQRTDWHYHENPYFMYVMEGGLFDISKKQKIGCAAGSLIFHNWQEPHFNEKHTSDARGFHIEFEREWFAKKQLNIKLWEGSQLLEHPLVHQLLGKIYLEFKRQDEFTSLSVELLLLQLNEFIAQPSNLKNQKEPTWIKPLKDLLHQGTSDLSLKILSKKLGVHPVHLSRAIPKYFSVNLGEYLRQLKLKKALKHLLNPKLSLTEIAYECDFSDQSHFTRTFKATYGMTPKKYRSQIL